MGVEALRGDRGRGPVQFLEPVKRGSRPIQRARRRRARGIRRAGRLDRSRDGPLTARLRPRSGGRARRAARTGRERRGGPWRPGVAWPPAPARLARPRPARILAARPGLLGSGCSALSGSRVCACSTTGHRLGRDRLGLGSAPRPGSGALRPARLGPAAPRRARLRPADPDGTSRVLAGRRRDRRGRRRCSGRRSPAGWRRVRVGWRSRSVGWRGRVGGRGRDGYSRGDRAGGAGRPGLHAFFPRPTPGRGSAAGGCCGPRGAAGRAPRGPWSLIT